MAVFPDTKITKAEALEALRAAAWEEPEEATFEPLEMKTEDNSAIALPVVPATEPKVIITGDGEQLYRKVVIKPARQMVHTMAGFGMDLPLESCEDRINKADEVLWSYSPLRHDLIAVEGDRAIRFEVYSPLRDSSQED